MHAGVTFLSRYRQHYIKIIKLGLPILVGQLGMITVGFADNIMVGRYSTSALASASFVNNIFNMAILCCMGFSMGLTPLVGALFARGEKQRSGAVTRIAMKLNIIVTLAVTALMGVVYLNIENLGQPAHLMPYIKPYFLIYLAGMVPITIFNVLAQWSYGVNDTFRPMAVILSANIINITGNWLLIFGNLGLPELGLEGAGLSTLAARVFTAVVMGAYFMTSRRCGIYRQGWRAAATMSSNERRAILKKAWKTSIPVSLQMTFETGSFSLAAVMVGLFGEVSLAAFQIIIITGTLGFCIYYSAGAAVAVLVSHKAGVNDAPGMRQAAWAGYHILLTLCLVSSVVFALWGRNLMSLFSDDAAVTTLAFSLLVPLLLYQVADATQINFANALRGTSRVTPMLWIAFVSYIIIGLPATYVLAFPLGMKVYGVVLSFSVSLLAAAVLYLIYFLKATHQVAPGTDKNPQNRQKNAVTD